MFSEPPPGHFHKDKVELQLPQAHFKVLSTFLPLNTTNGGPTVNPIHTSK